MTRGRSTTMGFTGFGGFTGFASGGLPWRSIDLVSIARQR
jgi:hypothetical protein